MIYKSCKQRRPEPSTKEALLLAAESVLEREGANAVTTRGVCEIANVKAPTLYFHFGDKNGLLDAVLEQGVSDFLKRQKASPGDHDALVELSSCWKRFLVFGLERPNLFQLMVQRAEDNPQLLNIVFPSSAACLTQLAAEGRLALDVPSARLALLALFQSLALLRRQGTSKKQIAAVSSILLDGTLNALLRANPDDS